MWKNGMRQNKTPIKRNSQRQKKKKTVGERWTQAEFMYFIMPSARLWSMSHYHFNADCSLRLSGSSSLTLSLPPRLPHGFPSLSPPRPPSSADTIPPPRVATSRNVSRLQVTVRKLWGVNSAESEILFAGKKIKKNTICVCVCVLMCSHRVQCNANPIHF